MTRELGEHSSVLRLKYFTGRVNAGDRFSCALARSRFDAEIEPAGREGVRAPNLILLGSILQWSDRQSHVCGAGLIRADQEVIRPPKNIVSVRGPLTRAALLKQDIECPEQYGDPGVLADTLFPDPVDITHKIGIIPHYVDVEHPWLLEAEADGALIISVESDLQDYFQALKSCEIILSTTLHGLIFAHAFGRAALWIELSDKVIGDGFKFFDYYASLGLSGDQVHRVPFKDGWTLPDLAARATIHDQSDLKTSVDRALRQVGSAMNLADRVPANQ
jgi:pyruvyltransferase